MLNGDDVFVTSTTTSTCSKSKCFIWIQFRSYNKHCKSVKNEQNSGEREREREKKNGKNASNDLFDDVSIIIELNEKIKEKKTD